MKGAEGRVKPFLYRTTNSGSNWSRRLQKACAMMLDNFAGTFFRSTLQALSSIELPGSGVHFRRQRTQMHMLIDCSRQTIISFHSKRCHTEWAIQTNLMALCWMPLFRYSTKLASMGRVWCLSNMSSHGSEHIYTAQNVSLIQSMNHIRSLIAVCMDCSKQTSQVQGVDIQTETSEITLSMFIILDYRLPAPLTVNYSLEITPYWMLRLRVTWHDRRKGVHRL